MNATLTKRLFRVIQSGSSTTWTRRVGASLRRKRSKVFPWSAEKANSYQLACNNDAAPMIQTSRISFAITNGSIYSLVVDGVNGASGVVKLTYKASPNPPSLASLIPPDGLLFTDTQPVASARYFRAVFP